MREGRSSTTAAAVAYARAVGTGVSPPDPIAPRLLPAPLGAAARAISGPGTWSRAMRWVQRAATGGMIDHVNLRTAAIDTALQRAVVEGTDQLVILGAGLDARAWRLPWLSGCDVIELDHPATQEAKRERLGRLAPTARTIDFAAIDFEHESLEECLARCSHDSSRKTAWIWEGVTPYLDLGAVEATLSAVAKRSAPDSVLLMSYAALPLMQMPLSVLSDVVLRAFALLGEPLRGAMTSGEAYERLERYGFEPLVDTDHTEWARGRTVEPTLAYPFRAERLLESRRRRG